MKIIRNIAVAFSLYSKIPMPVFEWKENDLKYNLVFLPWIGIVIGCIEYFCAAMMRYAALPEIFSLCVFSVIPLLVTGGFHLDGFLDVKDALSSYKSKEEKLVILKDPHIGAFAVIKLLCYCLVWGAALSITAAKQSQTVMAEFCLMFFVVRAAAAISSLCLKHAKKDGMLNMETKSADSVALTALTVELLAGFALMLSLNIWLGLISAAGLILFSLHYKAMCYKQFGGVTGDTTGYFVTVGELAMLLSISIGAYLVL